MKKIYQSEKHKSHYKSVYRKILKRQKSRENKTDKKSLVELPNADFSNNEARIIAPTCLSIIDNCEETLVFFDSVDKCVRAGHNIYFDLSGIVSLSNDAIIYLLSRINYYKHHHSKSKIAGNVPLDASCNDLLDKSGFFNYVYSRTKYNKIDSSLYSIKSESIVSPLIAQEVALFTRNSLGITDDTLTREIYTTLIECMANTNNHAYINNVLYSKWWLIASYNKDKSEVNFSFLDNGSGIPVTIRKDFKEIIMHIMPLFKNSDSKLIMSSLLGKFRTRTKSSFRGKGLPKIYKNYDSGKIKRLSIVSKSGYINLEQDKILDISKTFHGTLLTWSFSL